MSRPSAKNPAGGGRFLRRGDSNPCPWDAFLPYAGPQCGHAPQPRRFGMNKDKAAGQWKQIKGKVKEQWGKLTDDDLTVLEGNEAQLIGKVQERYGIAK